MSDEETNIQANVEEQTTDEQAAAEQAAAEQAAAEQTAAEQTDVEDEASYFKKVLTGEVEMTEIDEEKIYSKVGGVRQKIIDNIYNKDEKRKVLLVYLKNIKFR